MRETVKVRRLGSSIVVTIPQRVLKAMQFEEGDYALLDLVSFPQGNVLRVTKEEPVNSERKTR